MLLFQGRARVWPSIHVAAGVQSITVIFPPQDPKKERSPVRGIHASLAPWHYSIRSVQLIIAITPAISVFRAFQGIPFDCFVLEYSVISWLKNPCNYHFPTQFPLILPQLHHILGLLTGFSIRSVHFACIYYASQYLYQSHLFQPCYVYFCIFCIKYSLICFLYN